MYACDDGFKCDSPVRMGLGTKKYFAMTDVLGMRCLKVGPGHIVEVVFTYKYSDALIVDIEEGLEIAKFIGFMDFFQVAEWEPRSIARRELEHEFGLQRTLNVNIQFCFWNLLYKCFHQALLSNFNRGIGSNPNRKRDLRLALANWVGPSQIIDIRLECR